MDFCSLLTRPIVSQVVLIYAVDNVLIAVLGDVVFQAHKQFIFAVKAAGFVVLNIVGILEFECRDILMPEASFASKRFRIPLM